MKSCNNGGYCSYKTWGGSLCGCNYEGYCDYQAPRDSRPLLIPPLEADPYQKCTCGGFDREKLMKIISGVMDSCQSEALEAYMVADAILAEKENKC
jgi:hypothetical protein